MATGSGIAIRLGRWLSHRGQYLVETWWMERSFCSWDIMQEDEDSKKNGRDEKEGWLEGGTAVVDQVIWISICYFNRWLVDGLGWWFGIPVVPIIMYHVYIYIGGGATIYIYIIYAVYINMSQKPGREVPGFQPAGPENWPKQLVASSWESPQRNRLLTLLAAHLPPQKFDHQWVLL